MNGQVRVAMAAVVITVGLSVAGCSGGSSGLDAETSQNWQTRVVTIAETADTTDHAAALAELDTLEAEVAQARVDGEISAERAAIIQQSIALVRADLESAAVETTVPEDEDSTVSGTDDEDENSNENSNKNSNENSNKNSNENSNKNKKDDKKDNNGKGNGD